MTIFEKALNTIKENLISYDEIYHGVAFLFYSEIITHKEYKILMEALKNEIL